MPTPRETPAPTLPTPRQPTVLGSRPCSAADRAAAADRPAGGDNAEPSTTAVDEASAARSNPRTSHRPPCRLGSSPSRGKPQPIFVQAPEEPRPRGNRAAAGGIGIIAAICFAVLYLAAGLAIGLVTGDLTGDKVGSWLSGELTTWGLWVPTAVFFLAFWLLGAIINRGRWGVWVILGLLVGLAAYGGHLLGQLFEAQFWMITAQQGAQIVQDQLFAPLAIAALVIARELTIWFSAWIAARGKRMTELNIESRREYERTLEAGPQLAD
ncbi:ABC transporter [Microbacterium elymi]|uniref:ABC transporter n=1 Tax=Microbacterium elymi TaxID=2909587 RepID=A0ABY5NL90_9MICO|nr:ABC transporter [Microbacterium elymi]UUT35925.1 ABC transporter [Microbacterium elymi]